MELKLENFEGPLDLLLQLIEKEELDITKVALFDVAEQYINYLDKIETKNPEVLADFLVVAARLLYIKSYVLLPDLDMGYEESSQLEEQLKLYKKYYEASKDIAQILELNNYSFSRIDEFKSKNIKFAASDKLNKGLLSKTFLEVISGIEFPKRLQQKTIGKLISIKQKIKHIKDMLCLKDILNFDDVIGGVNNKNKSEIIVSFLGVLELVKQQYIYINQADDFKEIEVRRVIN
ncbi:MAG: segregation/condensation protein A [Candidatus Kuenenbacteria bacterium]